MFDDSLCDDDMMVDCFDIDDDVDVGSGNKEKESTGRWTREEHLAFIKGLELHGKGWKKIATLIKTRTVVQIRTHAQKYFLKLSKARQNGDTSLSADGRGHGNQRKKKSRQRYCDKPIAVAPSLVPFLKEGSTVENAMEVNDGIYNFLSPAILLPRTENLPVTNENGTNTTNTNTSTNTTNTTTQCYNEVEKPSWFLKGADVSTLLKEAEECNWLQDSGQSVYSLNNQFKPLTAPMSATSRDTTSPREISSTTTSSIPVPIPAPVPTTKSNNRNKSGNTKKQKNQNKKHVYEEFGAPFNYTYPSFENFDALIHSGEEFGWCEEKVGLPSGHSNDNLKRFPMFDDYLYSKDEKNSFKPLNPNEKWMM